jgi:hypothetical protein
MVEHHVVGLGQLRGVSARRVAVERHLQQVRRERGRRLRGGDVRHHLPVFARGGVETCRISRHLTLSGVGGGNYVGR